MFTYKLTFDDGKKFKLTAENLTAAHDKIIKYINQNNLRECIIKCPNSVTRRVTKTGAWHWAHNGFQFD